MSERLDSAGPFPVPPDPSKKAQDEGRGIPVTDERDTDVHRERDNRRLLWETASILLTTDDPDVMLRELFAAIRAPLGIDFLTCFVANEDGSVLQLLSCPGLPDESKATIAPISMLEGVSAGVAPSVGDVASAATKRIESMLDGLGAVCRSCHPLIVGSRLVGAIGFASRSRGELDSGDVDVMHALSHQVALAHQCLGVVTGLREQDRNKDEFLATLAHELRTPLSAMRNGLQLLRLANDDPAVMLQARSILDRQVQQMIRLVDDLLDVSRVNSNRLELRKEWVELATVVKTAVETSRPAIEASRHELVVTLPTQPVLLDADPLRLAQALSNLLHNAAKYTEPGGTITLVGEQQGDRVVIRVRDTGMGIPAETLPHVFRMFMQARRSVAKSQGGLGIGLPLVKRLIEMHGGSVSVFSEGPGRGSEFTVRLPVLVVPRES